MKLTRIVSLVVLAIVSSAAVVRAQAPDPTIAAPSVIVPPKTYYDAVEVTVTGKAKAAGVVVLVFQTIGGDPKVASVNVLAKSGENDVARDLAKELTVIGGNAFKVKTKSGNVIVVTKAAKNAPNLSITLGMQTIPGIAVSFGEN